MINTVILPEHSHYTGWRLWDFFIIRHRADFRKILTVQAIEGAVNMKQDIRVFCFFVHYNAFLT